MRYYLKKKKKKKKYICKCFSFHKKFAMILCVSQLFFKINNIITLTCRCYTEKTARSEMNLILSHIVFFYLFIAKVE
jgi:hypothetical protein